MEMIPKYKIGDVVCMEDDFHHNPADEALSIGKIEAIHIIRGNGVFQVPNGRGGWKYPDNKRIIYTVSGFSLRPKEEDLRLYIGERVPDAKCKDRTLYTEID